MRHHTRALVAVFAVMAVVVLSAGTAEARCPASGSPSRTACRDVNAFFMPGLVGIFYAPADSANSGRWFGGGVQIVPYLWSHNTDKFGPGQGKIIFDIGLLTSSKTEGPAAPGKMLYYRFGGQLSLEKNASRTYAIPFFGVMFGGLNERTLKNVGFFEATMGLHAIYLQNVVVTLEGGYLFPFDKVDELAGFRATLALNFTMW